MVLLICLVFVLEARLACSDFLRYAPHHRFRSACFALSIRRLPRRGVCVVPSPQECTRDVRVQLMFVFRPLHNPCIHLLIHQ
jgi:hypothetical protein